MGPLIATAFVATLDEAGRFAGAHQVASYLGLVPSEGSSADRRRRGAITKAGDPRMRWLMVQAAWAARRSRRADAAGLRAWAEQLAKRRGSPIATVALARRLTGILFAMWRDHAPFDGRCVGAGISRKRLRQDLERHLPVELGISGLIDLSHAPLADEGGDVVMAESGADA